MKKYELTKGIMYYKFDPHPGRDWTTSAIVILNGKKALLIDTGYESQTPELLDDLASNQVEVEAVIISHFHDDHMEGIKFLPGIPVYGSDRFQETLDLCTPKKYHKYYKPTILVNEPKTINFGEHSITLIQFPGHSECTMLITIDDKFAFISDELSFTVDGQLSLPCLSNKNEIPRQIKALGRLKVYSDFTIIPAHPAHGATISGDKLDNAIQNLSVYLAAILESDGVITYEDAIKGCTCVFAHKEWHKNNCS